ncbi:hypothetical protein Acr_07g0015160 [Actinidia rufa]|uniref:GAG-pre-integrase domain-containing protein n=1 Tax=Actinidia rufa TaxID=165716 RepID=A0A7J0EY06_9ERIC|nr:hypothetical protein Acr_07g0015160 [Actinidia rufa]
MTHLQCLNPIHPHSEHSSSTTFTSISTNALLWHRRLGHPISTSPPNFLIPLAYCDSTLASIVPTVPTPTSSMPSSVSSQSISASSLQSVSSQSLSAPSVSVPPSSKPVPSISTPPSGHHIITRSIGIAKSRIPFSLCTTATSAPTHEFNSFTEASEH